eukprot:TRINITY_DN2777_c0_g1_i3.p1 TRINITY_DN2777_c0_g1~~TRINITY_DN2777_c0_g1_i3.p1  ORF type:complete len:328 (-),score=83.34 TRINITY_DN2777_c0_g1_i3:28-1011(-)
MLQVISILLALSLAATVGQALDLSASAFDLISTVMQGDLEGLKRHVEAGGDVPWAMLLPSLLQPAVRSGNVELVEYLFEKGVDVNAADATGRTALMFAAYYNINEEKMVEMLIDQGATFDVQERLWGLTALHYACMDSTGKSTSVAVLLRYGANPGLQDNIFGWTPLHYAYGNENSKNIALLLKYGAQTNVTDIFGNTPINASKTLNIAISIAAVIVLSILGLTCWGFYRCCCRKRTKTTPQTPAAGSMQDLDVEGVVSLLLKWGLDDYERTFREKKINGNKLMSLAEHDDLLGRVVGEEDDRVLLKRKIQTYVAGAAGAATQTRRV